MIYFAQSPDGGPIKIGCTHRLDRRLVSLRSPDGMKVRILVVMSGSFRTENRLHRRFESSCYPGFGREWFNPDPPLLDFIARKGLPWQPKKTIGCRRRKARKGKDAGPIIAANLERLGYAETTIKTAEIARLVKEKTGKGMSRQRIAAILNAVRVTPETIEMLADALGVKPGELTKRSKGKAKP